MRRRSALAAAAATAALLAAGSAAAAARFAVPVEPGREEARGWAARELAGREYEAARPGLLERALSWLFEQLGTLRGSDTAFSLVVLAVVLVVIGAVIGWAILRAGGVRRSGRRSAPPVLGASGTTAAGHRAAADAAAAREDWREAVLERFRAVARALEEQAVLAPQPGRTARELARDAGAWLPDLAADLGRGADLFDGVAYGGSAARAEDDARVRALDEQVRRARPVATAGSTG